MKILKTTLATIILLVSMGVTNNTYAQCSTTTAPTYANDCTAEYFTAMSASGATVVSTISLTGGTCSGTTYFDHFATQGITVTAGNTVNLDITRYTTTYTAYLTVYIDLNNDGTYEPATELVGTSVTMPSSLLSATYSFLVPAAGIVTGTHLHMRVFFSEIRPGETYSPPCDGTYGQAFDYYFQANCGGTTSISTSPTSATICLGSAGVSITASGAGISGSYTWAPASGLSATTGAIVTATPSVTTIYTVTGTSSAGCSGSATDTVTITSSTAAITPSGPQIICSDYAITLSTTAVTGDTYQWYNGGTTIAGATSDIYAAELAGSYTVKVITTSGCIDTSAATIITVHSSPLPIVTFNGKRFITSSYYASYQWYENGTLISGATFDSVIAHSNGDYTVKVTDTNGCTGISSAWDLTNVAVPNITCNGAINIYPNPANNIIYIEAPVSANVVISNPEGRAIIHKKGVNSLDISNLTPGLYLIELFDESGHRLFIQKLVKN